MKNISNFAGIFFTGLLLSGCTYNSNHKPDAYFVKSNPQKEKTKVYMPSLEAVLPKKENFDEESFDYFFNKLRKYPDIHTSRTSATCLQEIRLFFLFLLLIL